MKIAIMDGQGAGLGQSIIKRIRRNIPKDMIIIALGTNTLATSKMVRAGADLGISGESGFCAFCRRESIDCMIAPIGIIQPGSIHGEITEKMVHSFSVLTCKKYLLPVHHPNVQIPCTSSIAIKDFISAIINDLYQQSIHD